MEQPAAARGLVDEANPALSLVRQGDSHAASGEYAEALRRYREAVRLAPNPTMPRAALGALLCDLGAYDEATEHLRAALEIEPAHPMARIKLDAAIAGLNPPDLAAAVERLKAAALRVPEIAGVHATIGGMLQRLNRAEEARQHFSTAVALAPDNLVIRLRSVMAELPVIYERASEIPERRRAYSEGLSEFERVAAAGTPDPGHVIEAVGSAQPFLLGYQGENDRELQRRYGAAVCALMARAVPEAGL